MPRAKKYFTEEEEKVADAERKRKQYWTKKQTDEQKRLTKNFKRRQKYRRDTMQPPPQGTNAGAPATPQRQPAPSIVPPSSIASVPVTVPHSLVASVVQGTPMQMLELATFDDELKNLNQFAEKLASSSKETRLALEAKSKETRLALEAKSKEARLAIEKNAADHAAAISANQDALSKNIMECKASASKIYANKRETIRKIDPFFKRAINFDAVADTPVTTPNPIPSLANNVVPVSRALTPASPVQSPTVGPTSSPTVPTVTASAVPNVTVPPPQAHPVCAEAQACWDVLHGQALPHLKSLQLEPESDARTHAITEFILKVENVKILDSWTDFERSTLKVKRKELIVCANLIDGGGE